MKTKKSKIVTIRVTNKDIKKGVPENGARCPIALACLRRLNHQVHVTEEEIDLIGDGSIDTPRIAARFIERFDDLDEKHRPVKPFSFKLKLTPEHREFLGL
jgi:hypothetical protein